ncbi:MAG: hypothetical protein ACRD3W_30855, partial [Terriglobales bacterium]
QYTLGWLIWFDANHTLHKVDALGKQIVPSDRKIVFRFNGGMSEQSPTDMLKFNDGDIYGAIFNPAISMDDDTTMRRLVRKVTSLRGLYLYNVPLSREGLADIGAMLNLNWLFIYNRKHDAKAIASLNNLPQLRVLGLHGFTPVTPVLERLVRDHSKLERLGVESCHLTLNDLKLISQLHSLKRLDMAIGNFDLPDSALQGQIFDEIAKLKHLERVAINIGTTQVPNKRTVNTEIFKKWKGLKNLKLVAVVGYMPSKELEAVKANLHPGCAVIRDCQDGFGWTELEVEDPAIDHLW